MREKTLQHYINKKHVRYMPESIQTELAALVPRCAGDAAERMYWVLFGLEDYPTCKGCHTLLTSFHWEPYLKPIQRDITGQKQGYRPYCGRECAYTHGTKKESYKKTCIERYGVSHPMKTERVIAKIKATNIDRHGEESPMRWTGKKFLDAINTKYGTSTVRHIPGVHETIIESQAEATTKALPSRIANLEKLFDAKCLTDLASLGKIYRVYDHVFRWRHTCGREYESVVSERGIRRCPSCSSGTSKGEQEVFDFVYSLDSSAVQRTKSVIPPREIDIWIPEKKIAIEFDGTYWHSAKFEGRKMCLDKLESCEALGIQLITLQEHLWVNKPEVVKNRLSSILKSTTKIGARKTEVKEIHRSLAAKFLEKSHLQASAGASIFLGLFLKEELVSVATFGKPRWAHGCSWELIRMASKPGITIQGGASKLMTYFRKNRSGSLISYADRCWSQGNVYRQLGFRFSHNAPPSYWWVHHELGTYARYQTQKKKLPRLLGDLKKEFAIELSEEDNMRMAGFLQLFDRGNSVWILD